MDFKSGWFPGDVWNFNEHGECEKCFRKQRTWNQREQKEA